MTKGTDMIAAERERQIRVEGWTPEHDDEHYDGDLAAAAACYALKPEWRVTPISDGRPEFWPWAVEWWKPCPDDRIRELVKAGALIAAEIDRLLRAEAAAKRELPGGDGPAHEGGEDR